MQIPEMLGCVEGLCRHHLAMKASRGGSPRIYVLWGRRTIKKLFSVCQRTSKKGAINTSKTSSHERERFGRG